MCVDHKNIHRARHVVREQLSSYYKTYVPLSVKMELNASTEVLTDVPFFGHHSNSSAEFIFHDGHWAKQVLLVLKANPPKGQYRS